MKCSRQSDCSRAAFTLLEIMVALSLMGFLFVGIFRTINLQARVRAGGERQVQRAQQIAGTIADLTADLRLVREPSEKADIRHAPVPVSSLWTPPTRLTSSDFTEQVLEPSVAASLRPTRFWGTANMIVLEASEQNRRFDADTQQHAATQLVVWWCRGKNSPRVLLAHLADRPQFGVLRGGSIPSGLTRWSISTKELLASNASWTNLNTNQGTWTTVRPDVVSLRFRYFDGRRWHSEWNCQQADGLPQAIEFQCLSDSVEEESPVVIHLPLATRGAP